MFAYSKAGAAPFGGSRFVVPLVSLGTDSETLFKLTDNR